MPIVALVFTLLGFCLPPLLIVGVIIGIVALIQNKGSLAVAIVSVVLPVTAIPVIGILAAIAIPNFIKFQARSKQSECKANLKSAFIAEKSYFAEHDAYDAHPSVVGFSPEKGNRYLYAFADGDGTSVGADTVKFKEISNEKLFDGIPAAVKAELGLHGKCPDCSITIACAGNVDNDPTVDVWTISTLDRPGSPPGTVTNVVDDIRD